MASCIVNTPCNTLIYSLFPSRSLGKATRDTYKDSSYPLPQAIVCANSTLAVGVAKALQELSLAVPKDIGLLAFDTYPYSDVIAPVLTVVDINVYDMGAQAGNMMIRKLENPDLFVQSFTALPVLIQGESTVLKDLKGSIR